MNVHSRTFALQRRLAQNMAGLSAGELLDLILAQAADQVHFPLFSEIARTEARALLADLERVQGHLDALCVLRAGSASGESGRRNQRATPGALLDFFLEGVQVDSFLEYTQAGTGKQDCLAGLQGEQRARFAYGLLAVQSILEGYRSLVHAVFGGGMTLFGEGAFARHSASGTAGWVVARSSDKSATIQRGSGQRARLVSYPQSELLVTARPFVRKDTSWVFARLSGLMPGRYAALLRKDCEGEAWFYLLDYRWIYDRAGCCAYGLALITPRQGPASSKSEWESDSRAAIRGRVGAEVTLTIDCIPCAGAGPSFFQGGTLSPNIFPREPRFLE